MATKTKVEFCKPLSEKDLRVVQNKIAQKTEGLQRLQIDLVKAPMNEMPDRVQEIVTLAYDLGQLKAREELHQAAVQVRLYGEVRNTFTPFAR
jgi:hypothetical protein